MSQTAPDRSTTDPVDQPHPAAPTAPPASLDTRATTRSARQRIADADILQTRPAATRLCVLCGRPLRAGQQHAARPRKHDPRPLQQPMTTPT